MHPRVFEPSNGALYEGQIAAACALAKESGRSVLYRERNDSSSRPFRRVILPTDDPAVVLAELRREKDAAHDRAFREFRAIAWSLANGPLADAPRVDPLPNADLVDARTYQTFVDDEDAKRAMRELVAILRHAVDESGNRRDLESVRRLCVRYQVDEDWMREGVTCLALTDAVYAPLARRIRRERLSP